MTLSHSLSSSFAAALTLFAIAPQATAQQAQRAQHIQILVQEDTDWAALLVASDDAMIAVDGLPILADARVLQVKAKGPVPEDDFGFAVEIPVYPGIKRYYAQVVLYDVDKGLRVLPAKLLEVSDQLIAQSDDPIYHPEDYPIKVRDLPAAHDSARVRPTGSDNPDGTDPPTDQQLLEDSPPMDSARVDPRDPDADPTPISDQQALEDAAPIDSARKPASEGPTKDDFDMGLDSVHAEVKDLTMKAGRASDGRLNSFFATFTATTDGHDLQIYKTSGDRGITNVFLYRKSPGKGEGMNDVVETHDAYAEFAASDMVRVWLATGDLPLEQVKIGSLTFQLIAELKR